MKLNPGFFIIMLSVFFSLTNCATNPNEDSPALSNFNQRTLPTGGSDAALAAHKM